MNSRVGLAQTWLYWTQCTWLLGHFKQSELWAVAHDEGVRGSAVYAPLDRPGPARYIFPTHSSSMARIIATATANDHQESMFPSDDKESSKREGNSQIQMYHKENEGRKPSEEKNEVRSHSLSFFMLLISVLLSLRRRARTIVSKIMTGSAKRRGNWRKPVRSKPRYAHLVFHFLRLSFGLRLLIWAHRARV